MTKTLCRLISPAAALAVALASLLPASAQKRQGEGRPGNRGAAASPVGNQSKGPAGDKKAAGSKSAAAVRRAAEARRARERREAVAALQEAAAIARGFERGSLRVSVQTEIADALWPVDQGAARALLRDAWETTTAPGAVEAFSIDDASLDATDMLASARQAIITVAARHDAALAENYMRENARGLSSGDATAPSDSAASQETVAGPEPADGWPQPSPLGWQRLLTAGELIGRGEYQSASRVAAPVAAEGPSRPLLDFISRLGAFAPREAGDLYLRLLAATRADATADANDVLLLSTPVISPDLYARVGRDGATYFAPAYHERSGRQQPTRLMDQARRAFFETALVILARGAAQGAGSRDDGVRASVVSYFATGRLLPAFEREAPQHVPALRARLATLAAELDEARRNAADAQMRVHSLKPKNPSDPLRAEAEELRRATDEAERKRLRFRAVSAAARHRLWARARELAAEIGDAGVRRAALSLIAANQVFDVLEAFRDEEDETVFEKAAAFVVGADVPHAARSLGLAYAGELAARRGQSARASELFDGAETAAAQMESGTEAGVALYTLLIELIAPRDAARAWSLLPKLTAAINAADEARAARSASECPGIVITAPGVSECVEFSAQLPEPETVYARLAALDATRALTEARGLRDEAARILALVAASRSVLESGPTRRAAAR